MNAAPTRPATLDELDSGYDVIVAGAGGGGLAAAIIAARHGARVLLAEKSALIGGTYAYSAGLIWVVANRFAAADGVADSLESGRRHIAALSGGHHVDEVLDSYLSNAAWAIDGLAAAGVPFEWVPGLADYYAHLPGGLSEGRYLGSPLFRPDDLPDPAWEPLLVRSPYYSSVPVSHVEVQSWGGFGAQSDWDWNLLERRRQEGARGYGMATTGHLLAAALRSRIDIALSTGLDELVRGPGGDVEAVLLRSGGDSRTISVGAGLVLATGGYDSDPELQGRLDPHPPIRAASYPGTDGSGVRAALAAGASHAVTGGQFMAPVILRRTPEGPDGELGAMPVNKEIGLPGSLVVNGRGHRFADDSYYIALTRAMVRFDHSAMTYANRPAWLIVDGEWLEKYHYRFPMLDPDREDWLVRGDDPRTLAAAIDVDANTLASTIEVFNRDAATGVDSQFGRGSNPYVRTRSDLRSAGNPTMRALSGTLYAIQLDVASMGTLSGLRIGNRAQVLDTRDAPIGRLYASGNTAANQVGGLWYNSGLANGMGLIFGALAAATSAATLAERTDA